MIRKGENFMVSTEGEKEKEVGCLVACVGLTISSKLQSISATTSKLMTLSHSHSARLVGHIHPDAPAAFKGHPRLEAVH